jgi:hypothetical protein
LARFSQFPEGCVCLSAEAQDLGVLKQHFSVPGNGMSLEFRGGFAYFRLRSMVQEGAKKRRLIVDFPKGDL